jgi:hypothetical protein
MTAKPISFGTNIYDDWAKIGQALDRGYFNPDNEVPSAPRLHDKSFSLAMKEGAIRGEVQETAEVLSSYQWFKQAKRLLDIGGTHGLYSIAFSGKNPDLKATIFDFPGVPELAGAANLIKNYGMENRIEIVEGDFIGGNIGKGYDIAFISHVYFQGDRLKNVLKNIHQALNESQWFILKNCVINKNRKDSFTVSLHDLDMCFWSAEQHMFSIDEYIDQIEAYGFKIENMAKIVDCPYSPSTILMFRKTRLEND